MDSEDGDLFIKHLAHFIRTNEKGLANALPYRRQPLSRHGPSQSVPAISGGPSPTSPTAPERPVTSAFASNTLASALSRGGLGLTSGVKPMKLALTAHHLFYLLSRFEELDIPVGPMTIRYQNLRDGSTSNNYVSFLGQTQRSKSHGSDVGSIHSVSSIRSVMSGMSALWASLGIGNISAARTERQKAALQAEVKYVYASFTKLPALRLAPDWRARMIRGYEEFPFEQAVPLYVFKNVQDLEVRDMDFRHFFGWERLADQLRSLTLRRANIDDPADILIDIVLDDMERRRRRSSKHQASPTIPWHPPPSPRRSPILPQDELLKPPPTASLPEAQHATNDVAVGSLTSDSGEDQTSSESHVVRRHSEPRVDKDEPKSPSKSPRQRSFSPQRSGSRHLPANLSRGSHRMRRSGSGSSHSSFSGSWVPGGRSSSSNLLSADFLPPSKWRFLRHLSLVDNSLTCISARGLAPLCDTLHSLDLSSNLLTQIPESLASLTALRSLNLAQCMIDSLHSLARNPLPAITALNLRANRLQSIAGIEKLYPLERLDLRENRITDPMELARLTGMPELREIWVEGNPFTRTHRNYRVTLFNLFRKTPGFTHDIVIDASLPTYSEKRHLVERAPMPPAVPVIKPQPTEPVPAVEVVSKPASSYELPKEREGPAVLRKERPRERPQERPPHVRTAVSEVMTSSTGKRRRPQKRRIVDLAANDAPMPFAQPVVDDHDRVGPTRDEVGGGGSSTNKDPAEIGLNPDADNYRISQAPESQSPGAGSAASTPKGAGLAESPLPNTPLSPPVPRIDTSIAPQLPPLCTSPHELPSNFLVDWDFGGELYRRKIEDLRNKVGNGYLSVLSQEEWPVAVGAAIAPPRVPPVFRQHTLNHAASECSATSPTFQSPAFRHSTYQSPLMVVPPSPTSRSSGLQALHSARTVG